MKNILFSFLIFFLISCGGGSDEISSSENNQETNNSNGKLVNVTCPKGEVVKGKTSTDYENCPADKIAAKIVSFHPSKIPNSSYDVVSVKFDKPIKYKSGNCSISPAIPNVKCTVDYSSSSNEIFAKNLANLIIYSSKISNQYTVTFSDIRDIDDLKIDDIKINFQSYLPPTVFSKNGYVLATKDHLFSGCERTIMISTVYWNKCVEGLAFTGTTDPMNNEYCEIGFNHDGSISFYYGNDVYKTISRKDYINNDTTNGQYTFEIFSNSDFYMSGWLYRYGNDLNGQDFSVLLNVLSRELSGGSLKFESSYDLTDYVKYNPIKNIRKRCFINSIY